MAAVNMDHLLGFWDEANWNDAAWAEYRRRRREHGFQNRIEQLLHRLMGRFVSLKKWRAREAAQWPSTSGSYDPCEDHYNYLCGSGDLVAAEELLELAHQRRKEFLV